MENNESTICRTRVKLPDGRGLHGREAAMLVQLERDFESDLQLECGAQQANAQSIMSLLSLEADSTEEVTATAKGPDAAQMIRAVEHIFANGFRSPAGLSATSLFRRKFAYHFNLPQ